MILESFCIEQNNSGNYFNACLDQVQKIFSRMFFCFDKEHSGLGYTTYKRGETD